MRQIDKQIAAGTDPNGVPWERRQADGGKPLQNVARPVKVGVIGKTVIARVPEALLDAVPAMEVALAPDGSLSLPRVIVDLGFAPSTSEAARQIRAGGVKIDGERAADLRWSPPSAGGTHLLTVGAKKIARLVLVPPAS